MTPVVASTVASGNAAKLPSSTRNSPTNPLSPGSPIEESATTVKIRLKTGTTRAMPP